MKQDETYIAIAEIVRAVQNGEQSIDNATNEIMSINHLLSKKPSVSEEEIKDMFIEQNKCGWSTTTLSEFKKGDWVNQEINDEYLNFKAGFMMRVSLPPQVVQSEVSEELHIRFFDLLPDYDRGDMTQEDFFKRVKQIFQNRTLTPPDAEKEAVMFAEWIVKKSFGANKGVWLYPEISKGILTTQELFTLYKQGGK